MTNQLIIDYYTDVLCVWAWIAQRRIRELESQWGDKIQLRHHYINVFGDTATRINTHWKKIGSYAGFQRHVVESAAPFEEAPVNPEVWGTVKPATSANAHLVIKAAGLVHEQNAAADFALTIRQAFFVDLRDISELGVLLQLAKNDALDPQRIQSSVEDGSAMAALMNDYQTAQTRNITGSPSWVMNSGRQTLYGNIGYKVLHANVESFLNRNQGEASWC